jgi:hypothetical protein
MNSNIEEFLEKVKNLTKEDIEAIDAEYPDFVCRTNIAIDLALNRAEKASRRYNCLICKRKCRTSNKEAGTKTLCGECKRNKEV